MNLLYLYVIPDLNDTKQSNYTGPHRILPWSPFKWYSDYFEFEVIGINEDGDTHDPKRF